MAPSCSAQAANPFPALLSIFYSPDYIVTGQSRHLREELSQAVGGGLDEIIRHVPQLRDLIITSLVKSLEDIINLGDTLCKDEVKFELGTGFGNGFDWEAEAGYEGKGEGGGLIRKGGGLIKRRTQLMQYVR